jgi:hypothetical protein
LFGDLVVAGMQVIDIACDQHTPGIVPWPCADTVTRVGARGDLCLAAGSIDLRIDSNYGKSTHRKI